MSMLDELAERNARRQRLRAEAAAEIRVGGGKLHARMNGLKELTSLEIDPELLRSGDLATLESLVIEAYTRLKPMADYEAWKAVARDIDSSLPKHRDLHRDPRTKDLLGYSDPELMAGLRYYWQRRGWSLAELARRSDFKPRMIVDLIEGRYQAKDEAVADLRKALAGVLEISEASLLRGGAEQLGRLRIVEIARRLTLWDHSSPGDFERHESGFWRAAYARFQEILKRHGTEEPIHGLLAAWDAGELELESCRSSAESAVNGERGRYVFDVGQECAELSAALRFYRQERRWTPQRLSAESGVDIETTERWLDGEALSRSTFWHSRRAFSRAFGLSEDELCDKGQEILTPRIMEEMATLFLLRGDGSFEVFKELAAGWLRAEIRQVWREEWWALALKKLEAIDPSDYLDPVSIAALRHYWNKTKWSPEELTGRCRMSRDTLIDLLENRYGNVPSVRAYSKPLSEAFGIAEETFRRKGYEIVEPLLFERIADMFAGANAAARRRTRHELKNEDTPGLRLAYMRLQKLQRRYKKRDLRQALRAFREDDGTFDDFAIEEIDPGREDESWRLDLARLSDDLKEKREAGVDIPSAPVPFGLMIDPSG